MNRNYASGLAIIAATLGACAYTPEYDAPPAPPVNLTRVYFYPSQGQSEAQQDRDRYDCYAWAVDQTGFDPSRRIAPRETRATVVPARSPGETVAAAAVVGAVIGAATAGRGEGGQGALVGALAGTVVGAVAATAQAEDARVSEARYNSRGYGRYEREATEYRRAMSACLEGRGYSVR
jgi:uncharacterized protein YcfJ